MTTEGSTTPESSTPPPAAVEAPAPPKQASPPAHAPIPGTKYVLNEKTGLYDVHRVDEAGKKTVERGEAMYPSICARLTRRRAVRTRRAACSWPNISHPRSATTQWRPSISAR
jgi:hypothetical protein